MTWSELGVVIPSWIGLQSDVGYHLSINVLLLRIAAELTEVMIFLKPSFRHTASGYTPPPLKTLALSNYHPGAKEYNTPSGASWLYQTLGIMQLTWYKYILYLHNLRRCLHCSVNQI